MQRHLKIHSIVELHIFLYIFGTGLKKGNQTYDLQKSNFTLRIYLIFSKSVVRVKEEKKKIQWTASLRKAAKYVSIIAWHT